MFFFKYADTVQSLDQVLQNNLTLATKCLDTILDQGNHEPLKTFGIEKCITTDARYDYMFGISP